MISVCIATYNGEKFIKEQLDSILNQLSDEDEIIISDDSSTDGTMNIISSYQDRRIKIFPNQKFHSPIYNFENAINHCSGDFIFLSDQDDVWLPDKISEILPYLNKYDLVMSNARVVDSSLRTLKENLYDSDNIMGSLFSYILKNPYTGCLIAINRRCLSYVLPFPAKLPMHDIWIGGCCQLFSKVFFLNKNLILFRRHENNVSCAFGKSNLPYLYRIQYRVYVLFCLIKRYADHYYFSSHHNY
ncbi:glycosyltransferase family 2 protein [Bacteroides helcogenes]|uniref:Glycosyl transferase family 2 n=1 Tax=Bacteroides helcogenes (strain ATCC 35417 / DSM 20613 / JCM 6297 / CCUG 15421 / P 36-108) TaxID=693979 RepID=E6SS64_BACT6|nr:glycosyltransferase family 2 protein [Bacteroides helcogenes]ADV44132.1 glycosyl transferase family 2 [Bacteroides helcogenes P 36-108]MDY5237936.1 glycosyltransferase family 2 protein [Bacteroides helcogenes]